MTKFGQDMDPSVGKATQFQPGQSGNPNGVPKGTIHIKTLAQRLFNDPDTWNRLAVPKEKIAELKAKVGKDKTYGEALLYAWLTKALSDPRFAGIILELTDGKGKVEMEHSGEMNVALVEFMKGKPSAADNKKDSSTNT